MTTSGITIHVFAALFPLSFLMNRKLKTNIVLLMSIYVILQGGRSFKNDVSSIWNGEY